MKKFLNKKVVGAIITLIAAVVGYFFEFNLDDGTQATIADLIVSIGE